MRNKQILDILNNTGFISVKELSKELGVSEMTVRRDLGNLEKTGFLRRTHGGAILNIIEDRANQHIIRSSEISNKDKKRAIGKAAANLIQTGDSIYIDSGTTARLLADYIIDNNKQSFSLVTNSIIIASSLAYQKDIDTILVGGRLHTANFSLVGPLAEETVKNFRYNKAFIGIAGINLTKGLSVLNLDQIQIKKNVVENADQVIILVDSTKFNKQALATIIKLEQIHIIITDWEVDRSDVSILENKGIKVIIAEKE